MTGSCISLTASLTKCPICGSSEVTRRLEDIARCRKCGMQFYSGYYDAQEAAELYGREYFQGKVYRDYPAEAVPRIRLFQQKMDLLRPLLPVEGRLLDVGCAYGFFLEVAKERGFHVQGVDIAVVAVDYARSVFGSTVFHGELATAGFADSSFDVMTLWDTLEHLRNPHIVLEEASRILKPGGVLVVETLNINTLSRRLLRGRWPLYAPPYHLFYFTRTTAKKLLHDAGFTVRRQFSIQTYARSTGGVCCIRYFGKPILRLLLGWLSADVVLYVVAKRQDRPSQ